MVIGREQRCQLVDLARDFPQSDNYILTVVGHRAVYRRFDRGGYNTRRSTSGRRSSHRHCSKAITLKTAIFAVECPGL